MHKINSNTQFFYSPIVQMALLSLLCGLTLWGCSADGAPAPDLGEVNEFDAYRVYYAGEEVAGLPLEEILGEEWKKDEKAIRWTFIYGDCDPPDGPSADGGCAPPLQIQNHSTCLRGTGKTLEESGTFDFRGTKASLRRGRGFEVFTGRTTVVISGTRGDIVETAARQLRNVRRADEPALLPPPAREDCRRN